MMRLTNHDDQGNWSLKGVKWENLYEGAVIDEKTYERLYTALWRLKDYEDTGLDPDRIEKLKEENDWIPVEKEWPPFGKKLQATILHHEWISDYDSAWVPEKEKVHHAAYIEVCEIHPLGAMWCYACAEDDYHNDIAYIEPAKDLSGPVAEIIAWRPFPGPYQKERST